MKIPSFAVIICAVYSLLVFGYAVSDLLEADTITYDYERIDEVKKECASVLSSASALRPEFDIVYSLKEELSFVDGDWRQEVGKAPIMPFDNRDVRKNSFDASNPLNLVSFSVKDVDLAHRSRKYLSVGGFLIMGITRDASFERSGFDGKPRFQIWPGNSQLSISFEGIYTESKKNGGERVLCLLGSTILPSREPNPMDPWEWVNVSIPRYDQPPLMQDDQILLILHFPRTFTLTNRVIRGEMRSLNPKSNPKYFDEVQILSQLGKSTKYEFGSGKIVSKACDPYPFQDSLLNGGINVYKGSRFCEILEEVTRYQAFTVVPNWRCNGTDEFCCKLGPYTSGDEIKATDGDFKDVKIYVQNLKCEQKIAQENVSFARVSAVFRAVSPLENQYTAVTRSGASNMTVAAEGVWKSSSGQLCMVGCIGLVDDEGSVCNHRICLYIPISFSIKQRSIALGRFFSINKNNASYFPLSFEKLVQPRELWNHFIASHPYYSYSKIDDAGAILEKNEPFSFGTVIKKSLLQYPKLEDTEAFLVSLSLLSEDLTLQVSGVPDPFPTPKRLPRTVVQLEILSVGPLFGRYWSNGSLAEEENPYHTKAEYTEKQLLLNVSAQLTLTGKAYNNFSALSLEGLYDPHVGKMYLVGCRDVRASWKILFESMDLEAGMDCLVEVVISYPSTTARWLVNPTASISISSKRNEDDPLHFGTIKLQTSPHMYRKQWEDVLSHRAVEGIIRILTLSLAIACILSQMFYIKHNLDSAPYISLVMLGIQALGYSLPLITGAEALFKRKASESYEPSYALENNQWFHITDYAVKLLVMVSFILTLRLCQKVWKSRIRLLTRAPLELHRVPSDRRVLLTTITIHVIGYVIVLIIHSLNTSQRSLLEKTHLISTRNSHVLQGWETLLEEYVGLVQDFFLLPQFIGNFVWQIDCRPLRKLYIIGITTVRLFPHIYDYIRAPARNPYFAEDFEFANQNFDFYTKYGDIAIPVAEIILVIAIYIQQSWNYEKLRQALAVGHCKLLPLGSRMYERIPSQSVEAELVCGVHGNIAQDKERDDAE
ncbi:hypothetical protein CJ030_MR3G026506 [Morella rubra]|uniref:RING-type E3 ubiquitin transferase n=1 Tax=Morella rubra TaxID=262757 RepID=A0A6A1W2R1_9ROSI|nr:hypothetical protein CJ030_MR3G026506 [Morella rubra]